MKVDTDGSVLLSGQPLHFVEMNCEGTAFANDTPLNILAPNGTPGAFRLFVPVDGPPIMDLDIESSLDGEARCTNSDVTISGLTTEMIEVTNTLTLPLEDIPLPIRVGFAE